MTFRQTEEVGTGTTRFLLITSGGRTRISPPVCRLCDRTMAATAIGGQCGCIRGGVLPGRYRVHDHGSKPLVGAAGRAAARR